MRFLAAFFRKLWHALDIFRRVLHLLLLLLFFGILVSAMRGSVPKLAERGALVIHPHGEIVEQLSGEPLERAINEAQGQAAPQTLLWDLTDAIRAAAKDKRVSALLIETDDLSGAGQAKLEELAAAIAEFKAANKKVIARGSSFDQAQYYLAVQADEVYLDPFGSVLLRGYGRYSPYLKDAIDKLGIDVHLYRVGKYKSAAEPLIRRDMSAEDREETLAYLQALWAGYREAVARARGKTEADITAYVEGMPARMRAAGGNAAMVAKEAGLVTDIKTGAEVSRRVVELVGHDPDSDDADDFRTVDYQDYLTARRAEQRIVRNTRPGVGVIVASGDIADGRQPSGTIGGESTSALIRKARLDKDVKAVVLRIDSPGGSVFASEQIYRELLALKASGKKLVVSMSDLAASGGYYIAAPADAIIASPNTLTGSIGVFGLFPTFNRSLQKLGVANDGAGTTPFSGLSSLRPVPAAVDQVEQASVERTYEEFLNRVAGGRNRTRDQVDAIAQGRVWAGSQAQSIGLVDRFGSYQDALNEAAQRAGLGANYRVKRIEPDLSFGERLLFQLGGTGVRAGRALGRGGNGVWGPSLAALPSQLWQPLTAEMRKLQRLAAAHGPVAYCFCQPD